MERTADRSTEEHDRSQEAIGHLAEIAKSAAAQKEHDAKMLNLTAASVTTVRQLLEADAKRARVLGWIAASVGAAATVTAIAIAVWVAHSAREIERGYQDRLLGEASERIAREADVKMQKARADSLHTELLRDRDSLRTMRSELSETHHRLESATTELAAAKADHKYFAEREQLTRRFTTREEHQQVREQVHTLKRDLSDIRGRLPVATHDIADAKENQRHGSEGRTAPKAIASVDTFLDPPHSVPLDGFPDCDPGTHECYANASGMCTRH
jgi:hypothetical protein